MDAQKPPVTLEEIKRRAASRQPLPKTPLGTFGGPLTIYDIFNDLGMTLSAAGGVKLVSDMIRLQITQKQGRKIRIKKGDFEIEFQGDYNSKDIEIAVEKFKMLKKDIESEEVTIIEP